MTDQPSNPKGVVLSPRERLILAESRVLHALATRGEMTRGEIRGYVLNSYPGELVTAVLAGLVAEGRIVVERKLTRRSYLGLSPHYRLNPDRPPMGRKGAGEEV